VQYGDGTPSTSGHGFSPRGVGTEAPGPTDDDIVDAEVIEPDGDGLVVLRESATSNAKKAKALTAARRAAERKGIVLPLSFDEIREPVLVAAALEAIG
jgi:hypothetical protein